MRRSSTFSLLLIGLAVSVPLLAQRAPVTGVRALANVRELHDIMITPASDAVFDASSHQPLDAKGWTAARNQALVLAESGNLLMVGTRIRDNGNWMKMSRALVDAAALAAAAAEKKDADALEAAADSITVACMECHRPYRDRGRQMGAPPK
jgi:cytochrome c553